MTKRNATARGSARLYALLGVCALAATLLVTSVLVKIFERKQEAREPFQRVVEVTEISTDPQPWGVNWPHQYNGYKNTAGPKFRGGSSAMPASKLDHDPWLKRLFAGYAFSIDYREARGHAYMLYDQGVTERVTKKPQAGACLHCHASNTVAYRREGLKAMGLPYDDEALAQEFHMEAVIRGFQEVSRKPYQEVLALVQSAPDGTPEDSKGSVPVAPEGGFSGEFAGKPLPEDHVALGEAHPVSCIDCHDPKTMSLRVTRPGFMLGIAALAKSESEQPHLPSIQKWRDGDRARDYDPNLDASRQEMRTFTCAQCHVEYYCANKAVLEFPWSTGLTMDAEEEHWEQMKFEDGTSFYDFQHGETGAKVFKVQHPEFELWSQGIHARSGVSCADCHMPYQRVGAKKVSSHDIRSPLETINNSCQVCHHVPEQELAARVRKIQGRTVQLMDVAAGAMEDMLDAILEAKASGVTEEELQAIFQLQRKAMWRLDYVASENSQGFHADQEAARILGESIDFSRQAQAAAIRLRTKGAPDTSDLPKVPIIGVSEPQNE